MELSSAAIPSSTNTPSCSIFGLRVPFRRMRSIKELTHFFELCSDRHATVCIGWTDRDNDQTAWPQIPDLQDMSQNFRELLCCGGFDPKVRDQRFIGQSLDLRIDLAEQRSELLLTGDEARIGFGIIERFK